MRFVAQPNQKFLFEVYFENIFEPNLRNSARPVCHLIEFNDLMPEWLEMELIKAVEQTPIDGKALITLLDQYPNALPTAKYCRRATARLLLSPPSLLIFLEVGSQGSVLVMDKREVQKQS